MKNSFLAFLTVLIFANCAEPNIEQKAREIHERVLTLDTHVDINTANFTADRNYTMDLPTQGTLPKMEEVDWT